MNFKSVKFVYGKKLIAIFCVLTMLCCIMPKNLKVVSADVDAATNTAVTTDYLNIRSGPSISYSVVAVLADNTTVTVLDNSNSNGWVKVKSPSGVVGYCNSSYLKFSTNNVAATNVVKGITTDYLNVRSGAGTTYSVITVLNPNVTVDIVDNTNSAWAKIKIPSSSSYGYVSKSYLKVITSSANSNTVDNYKVVTTSTTAVSLAYLNIRTGMGMNYSIITTVSPNTVMTVLDNSNTSWAKVSLSNGTVGYCSKQYIKITTKTTTTYTALKESDKGEAVKKLQERLKELRYYNGVIDSNYSNTVTLAVKKFQITSNMTKQDGVADSTTLANVYAASAPIATTAIILSSSSVDLQIGNTYTLLATTTPSGREVTFKSSNTNVATVSSKGVVTGIGAGTATITATDKTDTVVAKTTIKVSKQELIMKKISLSASTLSLYVGDTYTLTATTTPADCDIYWSTSRDGIVTVDNGRITVIGVGKVSVRASNKDGSVIARCIINTKEKPEITLEDTTINLEVNDEYKLSVNATPNNTKLVYTSSDEKVATIEDGKIKAVSVGTTTITVKDKDGIVSKQCKVVVGVRSITLNKNNVTINKGSSTTIIAKTEGNIESIVWTTSNDSVATIKNGVISALSKGTATITARSEDGEIMATCKVTVNDIAVSSRITLSSTNVSLTAGKTIYIKTTSTSRLTWSSSDKSIATVENGFIEGVSEGTAIVTAKDTNGNVKFVTVNVSASAPIKFVYATPNSALIGEDITLYAITDKTRTDVRFKVDINGKETIVNASSKQTEDNTYVWIAHIKVNEIGTFNVKAESLLEETWSSCDDGTTEIFVTSKEIRDNALVRELRVTDTVIEMIVDFEGFLSTVQADELTYSYIPNIGHGHVIWANNTFYNNITRREAYAMLANSINNDSYTVDVNKFFINNNIKFSQQHFDAMVCFSYNLGTGWTTNNSSNIRTYLLNAIDPNAESDSSGVYTARVISDNGLNVRSGPGTSYSIISVLNYNYTVTLVDNKLYNEVWYKVRLSNGTEGYCSSTYLSVSNNLDTVRNCNYINKKAFVNELLAYHHAGGNCYYGLLYRRGDELEMFLYGDYVWDGRKNKYGFPDTYCLKWP